MTYHGIENMESMGIHGNPQIPQVYGSEWTDETGLGNTA